MKTKLILFTLLLSSHIAAAVAQTGVPFGRAFIITWDARPPGENVTSYNVYERMSTGNQIAERSVGTTTQVPITPRPLGVHTYVVTAVNAVGEGPPSEPLVIEVTNVVTAAVPPGPAATPTGVLVNGNLTLSWEPSPVGEGVTSYLVYEIRNGQPMPAVPVNGTTLLLVNISPGIHAFRVVARNLSGDGPRGAAYSITIPPAPQNVPFAPLNPRATIP